MPQRQIHVHRIVLRIQNAAAGTLAGMLGFLFLAMLGDGVSQDLRQPREVASVLRQVVGGAEPKHLNGQALVADSRRHHDGEPDPSRCELLQDLDTIQVGQMVVEEHDVIAPLLQPGKTFLARPHHIQLELGAIRFQLRSREVGVELVVFRVEHTEPVLHGSPAIVPASHGVVVA